MKYAEEYGDDFISPSQAEAYFYEIQEGTFLEKFVNILISVDGIHKYEDNINFMRNVYKMIPQVTPGDPFYGQRCLVNKLQLKQKKITEKEIMIDEKKGEFLWFNKGTNNTHRIFLNEIVNAEIGFTPTFLEYLKIPKFSTLIENQKL